MQRMVTFQKFNAVQFLGMNVILNLTTSTVILTETSFKLLLVFARYQSYCKLR